MALQRSSTQKITIKVYVNKIFTYYINECHFRFTYWILANEVSNGKYCRVLQNDKKFQFPLNSAI